MSLTTVNNYQSELNKYYNINKDIYYCESKYTTDNANNLFDTQIAMYQTQLREILHVKNADDFQPQCDVLYDCINRNDKAFMDTLILKMTTNNNSPTASILSNDMHFYFCCVALIDIDTTVDFNALDYIDKDDFRKLVFGFAFSYTCFGYFHLLMKDYYYGIQDGSFNLETYQTLLYGNFNTMFVS